MNMHKVKVGVVGTGYLGSIHAKLYRQIDSCTLEGVCDINTERARKISSELQVPSYTDYKELFDKVQAVSIVVPTRLHHAIARDFLQHNIHTLVEKPFTATLKEADALISLSRKRRLILAVGHIERFNSAFAATRKIIHEPKFIESHRLSPFPNRSIDIGVVLDLMIHDIDIVLGLVNSKLKKIEAVGVPVLTPMEDIANARLTFKNGCVCNLTVSRVSDEYLRKIRIFQKDTYISLDYKDARACVYRKSGSSISKEDLPIEKEQPLQKELSSFIDCVLHHKEPPVSGTVGREALAVALEIQKQIWKRKHIS
jgi:predicted dehydrogenase